MSIWTHEEELLKKLTVAMIANPRATTGDLAQAAGISRATFNRFCGSRENLMDMIECESEKALKNIISVAEQAVDDYTAGLSALVNAHFKNKEYLVFVCGSQSSLENTYWKPYMDALDSFFMAGQKARAFRIDIPNQMMTELFISMVSGMIDSQNRGRVASVGLEKHMTEFFLGGVTEK
jgi:TetR/AcrR family transcriptional repressor of mexCD-oprJ operon